MDEVIKSPEYEKLESEVREKQQELSDILFIHDDLKYVICENIKTNYLVEIGGLEYEVFEKFCEFLRLRRKKELIQAKINRNEKPDLSKIEQQLKNEFADYQEQMQKRLEDIYIAKVTSEDPALTGKELKEFKSIYRNIIKKLHPDLNPNIDENSKELFDRAVAAYQIGDLEMLKVLLELTKQSETIQTNDTSIASLRAKIDHLEKLIEKVQIDIENIKQTTPYIWKYFLDNPVEKAKRINILETQVRSYEAAIKTQVELIEKMLDDSK